MRWERISTIISSLPRRPSYPSMADNIFAAFSFSGRTSKGASASIAARSPKVESDKQGREFGHASVFTATKAAHPRGSASSQVVVESGNGIGKVKRENVVEGLGVDALDSDFLEDGGNSRNGPRIRISGPRYQTVAKMETMEADEEEKEPIASPRVMRRIQVKDGRKDNQVKGAIQVKEENEVQGEIQVKEENQETVKALSLVNKNRPSHSNIRRKEEVCEEIEEFGGGGGLSCRSANSGVLEVKKVTMNKRQNTKQTKRSRCGRSSEVPSPPPNWEEAMQSIRTMRKSGDAPVDLLGPAQLVDSKADSETRKFHVLVAAIISSQTRDAVTAAAMKRLHTLPGGLTAKHLAEDDLSTETLEELLKPVGFYRQKAKQLKSMAEILLKPPYCGCVPRTLDELMKLPGVGPKVGLLVLWVGFGMGEVGLIVDTNVRRVCCRLGWVPEGSSAEQVRHELESWLQKDLWAEASFMLVGFGQQICKPIGPNCKECDLKNFCPSAFKCVKKVASKRIKE